MPTICLLSSVTMYVRKEAKIILKEFIFTISYQEILQSSDILSSLKLYSLLALQSEMFQNEINRTFSKGLPEGFSLIDRQKYCLFVKILTCEVI